MHSIIIHYNVMSVLSLFLLWMTVVRIILIKCFLFDSFVAFKIDNGKNSTIMHHMSMKKCVVQQIDYFFHTMCHSDLKVITTCESQVIKTDTETTDRSNTNYVTNKSVPV